MADSAVLRPMLDEVLLRRIGDDDEDPVPLPEYKSKGAAGADLCARLPKAKPVVVPPGANALIPVGFAIALPVGYEAQIRGRSGLGSERKTVIVGTIDADYRGEVKVNVINLSTSGVWEIKRGDRIAQMVIAPVETPSFKVVDELPATERGEGGFGSTGTR